MIRRVSPNADARRMWMAVAGILILRGALLGVPALTDPTESRYATIAMHMADSGDWVTPRLWLRGELVPYWGKPPLHFWLTAASFKAFGISAWAARLPSFLTGLLTIALTGWVAWRIWGAVAGATAALILASTGIFYPCLGASMIDMTLTMAVTGALAGFAMCIHGRSRGWGLAAFAFLALGFLTKGPIALVLAGLPIVLWATVARRWKDLGRLPWLAGVVLFLVIAVPWFVLAERATPGFLRYFFVNENFLRFVRHDYGDLYGVGHNYPYGTIWLALLVCFLPWTIPLGWELYRKAPAIRRDPWLLFALCWGLAPAILFTVGRQWLPAYLLPALPGLAIATARLVRLNPRQIIVTALVIPVAALAIVPASSIINEEKTTGNVLDRVAGLPANQRTEIVFYRQVPDSALFYGRLAGLSVSPRPAEDAALARSKPGRIVIIRYKRETITRKLSDRMDPAERCRNGWWITYQW